MLAIDLYWLIRSGNYSWYVCDIVSAKHRLSASAQISTSLNEKFDNIKVIANETIF